MTREQAQKAKDFANKYETTIRSIAILEDQDMGVATDMLKYEIRARLGMQKREDTYKGIPADFDWKTAEADYKTLITD